MGAYSNGAKAGRTRRLALPLCGCGVVLSRKAKNAGFVNCPKCITRLREAMQREVERGHIRLAQPAGHEAD